MRATTEHRDVAWAPRRGRGRFDPSYDCRSRGGVAHSSPHGEAIFGQALGDRSTNARTRR